MEYRSQFHPEPKLADQERRRRVVRLCCSFMRNLAFHRAGMQGDVQSGLLISSHPHAAFWRECHANFFDICVLEWCKLFVDRNRNEWDEHHWRRVVDWRFNRVTGEPVGIPIVLQEPIATRYKVVHF